MAHKIATMTKAGFLFLFTFLFILSVKAQKMQAVESIWSNNIQINGHLNEWGDSLSHYFNDQDLHYSFANDENYLYIAILVKNKDKQIQAAFNGFNIQINPNGRKKAGSSLIFPLPDRTAMNSLSNQEFDKPKDPIKMALSSIRAYYVQGFPKILDGPISLDNNYGVKAAVLIDSAGNLSYESAIPLNQLNLPSGKNGFDINIKINGLVRTEYTDSRSLGNSRGYPGYGGGYGGYGYDQRPRTVIQNREEPGTWQYLKLAIKP